MNTNDFRATFEEMMTTTIEARAYVNLTIEVQLNDWKSQLQAQVNFIVMLNHQQRFVCELYNDSLLKFHTLSFEALKEAIVDCLWNFEKRVSWQARLFNLQLRTWVLRVLSCSRFLSLSQNQSHLLIWV